MQKIIAQGAEATITKEKEIVIKNRISKSYRIKEIDEKLRKQRTKSESKILEKASKIIPVPKLKSWKDFSIEMDFIQGDKLSESLNKYTTKKQSEIMALLGKEVGKLHDINIIHGDLTTSNTILSKEKVYIIDFGLSFISNRIEDKAVDLHLIKQALEAKHFQNWEYLFKSFIKKYNPQEKKQILLQLKKVESRGRYKH